ncbi:RhuM family protein [Methanobrevibacter filiformis]|uniref:Uncharacterized protein n=1 Tax=Methanobrevibacter filiformis TaxID=55758 RepID=A0A166FFZ0_9EURY|nr:RhuM family protein [Methanobrevibacter filiformis]KZX17636.1 hypothetical protein MBFIL_00230 [Methanobrevibacter filiformis]
MKSELQDMNNGNIIFQNESLIIFEKNSVKWIVTKDNQILMTVKDIGLLGGNLDKTKRYERELRKEEFITPYKLNEEKCIYAHSVKKHLTGTEHSKMPVLYNYPAITQILAELRTKQSRQRNQQLGLLQEEIRTKGYFIKKDYQSEALKYLKSIRAEASNVQKALNSFLKLARDYNTDNIKVKIFYSTMQNKIYQFVTGQTSSEIIYSRANHKKENMGLTTWKGKKGVTKSDVQIGKNYLIELELEYLIKTVNAMIDLIDLYVYRGDDITIDYIVKVFDETLEMIAREKLTGYGKVSSSEAKNHAKYEYVQYKDKLLS